MTQWQSEIIHAPALPIHVWRMGQGKPVILLHGYTESAECLLSYGALLARTYDVIAIDARGHGSSGNPGSGYTNQDNAADVHAVITELGLVRPVLVGHSMGARTALTAAALYPHMLRAVVLEDPPLYDWVEPVRSSTDPLPAHAVWVQQLKALSPEHLIRRCINENPHWQANEILPWVTAKYQFATERIPDTAETLISWRDEIAALGVPALLVLGEPSCGAAVDAALAAECRERSSHIEVGLIRGAGHAIRRSAPEAYAALVGTFIRRCFL